MTDAVVLRTEFLGWLLQQILGDSYAVVHKVSGDRPLYTWEIRTVVEPIQYLTTVSLETDDVLKLNGANEDEQRDYLRSKVSRLMLLTA
jgi:hypothetical protein